MSWAEARRQVEQPKWWLAGFHAAMVLTQIGVYTSAELSRQALREEIQLRAAAHDRDELLAFEALTLVCAEKPANPVVLPPESAPLRLRRP